MNDKLQDSIDFVSQYYDADAFADKRGRWSALTGHRAWWRCRPAAAAAVIGLVLVASAATLYVTLSHDASAPEPTHKEFPAPVKQTPVDTLPSREKPLKLNFSDMPLTDVCNEIEKAYGVTLTDRPDTEEHLTLEYEGTADDIVATINDLLDVHIRIEE